MGWTIASISFKPGKQVAQCIPAKMLIHKVLRTRSSSLSEQHEETEQPFRNIDAGWPSQLDFKSFWKSLFFPSTIATHESPPLEIPCGKGREFYFCRKVPFWKRNSTSGTRNLVALRY